MGASSLVARAEEDYTGYNGKWTDETLIVQPAGLYIHKTLNLQIAQDGQFKGAIEYRQVNGSRQDRQATARFEGRIKNSQAQIQFVDEWGYAGIVELEFLRHQIKTRIKVIRTPKQQQAWGMFDDNVYYSRANYAPLLQKNEINVFSFVIPDTGQILTVAKNPQNSEYLVCRLGKGDRVELEYPRESGSSLSNYDFSSLTRHEESGAKTELVYLRFGDAHTIYTVYQEYQASNNQEFVGLRAEDPVTGKVVEQKGDPGSVLGSLSVLRFEKGIRQSRL